MREPELLKAFVAGWELVTNAATLLPGRLHEKKADSDNVPNEWKGEDYGLIEVKENPLARMTNGGPIREHIVTITVKTLKGISSLGTVMEAMASTTSGIPSKVPTHTALDNSGWIIDLWPAPAPAGGQTESRRQGRTIAGVSIAWRVQSRWNY